MSGGLNLSPTKKEGIMSGMKRWVLLSLFLVIISPLWLPLDAGSRGHKSKQGGDRLAASGTGLAVTYPSMPGPGKKVLRFSDINPKVITSPDHP